MTKESIDTKYVLGVDIGGTNTEVGIVDARGQILTYGKIPTGEHKEIDDYVDALAGLIRKLIDDMGFRGKIRGIGIGAPNGNIFTGSIDFAPNLPWKGKIPLADLVREKVGIPVVLTNDANAAAIGEMTYGAARGLKEFIVITLGTGVGSGIVVDGKLVYGHDGFAGELGHMIVQSDGRPCGCGRNGCLETYTSARGVARTAKLYLKESDEESLLRSIDPEKLSSKDIAMAAYEGDLLAKRIFEETGRVLGEACANFVTFSSPSAIILFGGLARSGDLLLKPAQYHMEKNLLKVYQNKVKLLLSELKESDAAILGASALGWEAK